MLHSFDIDIAKDYGLLEAILLNHLYFWIEKNRANDVNFFDNNYWTFNSTRAFNELFPYVTQKKIQTALNHLKEENIIITGNYNKSAYDRTLWYAITAKGKCIITKSKIESSDIGNETTGNGQPTPDEKPAKNPDEKPAKKETKKSKKSVNYDEIINAKISDTELRNLLHEFIKMRNLKKKPLTERALLIQVNKLINLSSNIDIQKKIVEKSIVKCWDEFYQYKEDMNNNVINRGTNEPDYSKYDR